MTVDKILAAGEYRDRTGRVWVKCPVNPKELNDCWWAYGRPVPRDFEHRKEAGMRLLIERDMHRDECGGVRTCLSHPVPHVVYLPKHEVWTVNAGDPFNAQPDQDTLAEAMDAAYRLAVSSV